MEIILITGLVLIMFYVFANPVILSLHYDTGKKHTMARITFFPFDVKSRLGNKKKPSSRFKRELVIHFLKNEMDTVMIIIKELVNLFRKTVISPDKYYLNIHLRGGLGPPDLTGEVYGAIELLRPIFDKSVIILYQPDFTMDTFHGTVDASLKFRIIHILKELFLCAWKLPKLKLIKIIYKVKKGGKDVRYA
jgi:hypothetical protein